MKELKDKHVKKREDYELKWYFDVHESIFESEKNFNIKFWDNM